MENPCDAKDDYEVLMELVKDCREQLTGMVREAGQVLTNRAEDFYAAWYGRSRG